MLDRGLHSVLTCVFSGAEVPADDQPLDLTCPRMLALDSVEGRKIARTVLLVAMRRGVGERLLSRYPPDDRERLLALLAADRLDAAAHDLRPSEESARRAWLDALGPEDIRQPAVSGAGIETAWDEAKS